MLDKGKRGLVYYCMMSHKILDVREPYEFSAGHVEGAINIPLDSLDEETVISKGITKDSDIVVYCKSGNRAQTAVATLHRLGFVKAINTRNQQETEKVSDSI